MLGYNMETLFCLEQIVACRQKLPEVRIVVRISCCVFSRHLGLLCDTCPANTSKNNKIRDSDRTKGANLCHFEFASNEKQ